MLHAALEELPGAAEAVRQQDAEVEAALAQQPGKLHPAQQALVLAFAVIRKNLGKPGVALKQNLSRRKAHQADPRVVGGKARKCGRSHDQVAQGIGRAYHHVVSLEQVV